MLCDICGKSVATVHLTEIIDDQMAELHLCENCARAKSMEMEQQFGLADLLAGLSNLGGQVEPQTSAGAKCPNCGLTYENFKKVGRLGCNECYQSFSLYLKPLLKKIHGSIHHIGKSPVNKPQESPVKPVVKAKVSQVQELKNQLQSAIQKEEFEKAAELRDKIKELEKKGET
ncbi:MAG: UvrB/UvrC motif-containing protein [Candidatus Omnitrophota bacterium]|nr:UvrB/UvrC motif-containing protein [Candidatus Omnitrophota bacterium]